MRYSEDDVAWKTRVTVRELFEATPEWRTPELRVGREHLVRETPVMQRASWCRGR